MAKTKTADADVKSKKKKSKKQNKNQKITPVKAGKESKIHDLESRQVSDAINKMITSVLEAPETDLNENPDNNSKNNSALNELCAKDIMQRDICWCDEEMSIQQATEQFDLYKCSYIAVGENNHIKGLLCKKDLLEAKSPYLRPEFAKWRRPIDYASLKIKIKWLLKDNSCETVRDDEILKDILQKMLWTKAFSVAVVDKLEKYVGIITVADIFESLLLYEQHVNEQKVKNSTGNKKISQAISNLLKQSKTS